MADDDKKTENEADVLIGIGGSGDDTIYGGDGGDVLTGGSGADTVYGGEGDDWIRGGSGNDTIEGGAGDDIIGGDAGDDTIYGGAGDDIIIESGGDDTLTGGEGADTFAFVPGHGDDTITDFDGTEDRIDLSLFATSITFEQLQEKMSTITDPNEPDVVTGVQIDLTEFGGGTITLEGVTDPADLTAEMFRLPGTGSPTDDTVVEAPVEGTDAHEFFIGDTGGETYRAAGGNDIVLAEEGDDTVYGGEGRDAIHGGEGDDAIYGGEGHDAIHGGEGADVIEGGAGNDFLTGGSGADTFVFQPDHGNDTITDFTDGEDTIDLSAFTDIGGFGDLSIVQQGDHVQIDLSAHGGGTITLTGFNLEDLDAADFTFHVDDGVEGM